MEPSEFANVVRAIVRDAAVDDTLAMVANPPGRRPSPELVELSGWLSTLGESERIRLRSLLKLVSHNAVFGVLAVLDGVRRASSQDGHFELRYVRGEESDLLVGADGGSLHELL